MSLIVTLLGETTFFILPGDLLGWLGLVALSGTIIVLLRYLWEYQKKWLSQQWGFFILLTAMVPFTSLLFGVRLPIFGALPLPGMAIEPRGPALMVLSALPWILAAGFLGPKAGAALGVFSGLLLAYWDTHNPFTPLEMGLLATLFAFALGQRFRTRIFKWLRRPIPTAFLLSLFYPLLFLADNIFLAAGTFTERLDYAITHVGVSTLAMGGILIVASLFASIIALAFPKAWGRHLPLEPSPVETSLEAHFLSKITPLGFALILIIMIGDWIVAGNAARQMLQDRMESAAVNAAEGVPYFLNTGQNLILQLARDPRLLSGSPEQLKSILVQDFRTVPFFNQLFLLDAQGKSLTGYPQEDFTAVFSPPEEQMGIKLALNGILIQAYSIPNLENEGTTQVSFLAAVVDENDRAFGVLIGRTDLISNPFTQPILASLESITDIGGEGLLIDENSRILYHPNPNLLMNLYTGRTPDEPTFYDDTAPYGTRNLVFYQPAFGRPWAVVLVVPAQRVQQLALNIAAPLLGMLVLISLISIGILHFSLRVVTDSLKKLARESNRIAQGKLDRSLTVGREDEVGQLRHAFEQMRLSLKARLDELAHLRSVSEGMSSSLEMAEAARPILESALAATNASAVRITLAPAALPNLEGVIPFPTSFGLGAANEHYSYLDEQILSLTRDHERVLLTNPARMPLLSLKTEIHRPEGLLAVALRQDNQYYGSLWVAYEQPHLFLDEEVRFLETLAGYAALASANARLFLTAEIERQRMAAILDSTPDPVLFTDYHNRVLLANPAALMILGLNIKTAIGRPVDEVILQEELVQVMRSPIEEKESTEVHLHDGSVYLTTVSSVQAEGQPRGRVCVMQDITHFKKVDSLKSEFVATVSHDLRSPLTLMRGYATMIEMVGNLNKQQVGYVRKIISGVESMSRLVNNLLDLGRIEAGVNLRLEMIPIKDVVERVIENLKIQATQKGLQLHTEFSQITLPFIEADHALLEQAMHNLVENAIKYTPSNGEIWVRVHIHTNEMVFEVEDTGIGVGPVDLPRLFEKFYRASRRERILKPGTGLGLTIVKSIAEHHGGYARAESQLGKGSIFTITVPLRQPKPEK